LKEIVESIYQQLCAQAREPNSEEKRMIERVKQLRPDLKPILEKVPIHILKEGTLPRWEGVRQVGVYYWTYTEPPQHLGIFIEEGADERVLQHEGCHGKLLEKYPELYPYMSQETRERLANLCVEGKIF